LPCSARAGDDMARLREYKRELAKIEEARGQASEASRMIYGSVCSGIEAATVAWHPLGWKALFTARLKKRHARCCNIITPMFRCTGDFTTIQKGQYDALTFLSAEPPAKVSASPDFAKGFVDDRGNLTLEFIRLAERLNAEWLVWENVPGVLSIDGGGAFGDFLGGLAELGYGFAYRILDAQYFGSAAAPPPCVCCRISRRLATCRSGSLSAKAAWDITPRREAGQEITPVTSRRSKR